MANPLATQARAIFDAALAAVAPDRLAHDLLAARPRPPGRVWVVGGGKASAAMAAGVVRAWGPAAGLVLVPSGYDRPVPGVEVAIAGHPLPTAAGVAAAARLEALLAQTRPDDTVVACISGGGSACLALPDDLDALRATTTDLLRGGAPIEEINRVRRRMNRLADGGLTRASTAPVLGLILSDVMGDAIETIASGPTLGADNTVLAGPQNALEAAVHAADVRGFTVHRWPWPLTGEARDVGRRLAADLTASGAWIGGGETTVTVRGGGRGGRNQELALAAADVLRGRDAVLLSAGTDGIDGPTDAAGGLVDGATASKVDVAAALADNDAYTALERAGALLRTGPTGTNVADLQIGLVP